VFFFFLSGQHSAACLAAALIPQFGWLGFVVGGVAPLLLVPILRCGLRNRCGPRAHRERK